MTTDVAVVGAYGIVGKRICEALGGLSVVRLGRGEPLVGIDAKVIVNAAAPLKDSAMAVLDAAISARAHYVDVGGEQQVMQKIYEERESHVRKAGIVALPGCGVDCVIGDLAAAWATSHLCGFPPDGGEIVRDRPGERAAMDKPLDEVAVSYVYDHFTLSAGGQAALFGRVGTPPLAWRRDRWEPARAGSMRRVNAGAAFGGEREGVAYAGGDALAVPRHIETRSVLAFSSTTRSVVASRALSLIARVLPVMPKGAASVLAPFATPEERLAQTTFAVIAQVARGYSASQITVSGVDPSRTTARIAAWFARVLVERPVGPLGIRAPAELVRAEPALRALADVAGLTIAPSFA